jgi:tetratricopeptide (TPR) repeat protein
MLIALQGAFQYHISRPDLKRARELATELRDLGETSGDIPTRVLGYDSCTYTFNYLGELTAARACAEKALALYDPAHRPFYAELMPNDLLVQMLGHSQWVLASLGHLDQALSQRDAVLQEARRPSHPHTLAVAQGFVVFTGSLVRLEPESLLHCADELLALSTEHGLGLYRAFALVFRGWCLAALGRVEEGVPIVTAGLMGCEECGFMVLRPWILTLLGDACRMAGQWQAALRHLAEAQRLAEETGERWFEAETMRLSGEVLLATGDRTGAEASYREAIAIAQPQSAKLWELCAAMSLARLWRDQGKRAQARDLLAPLYGWFTEGLGTPVLQDAKLLLDELARAPGLVASGGVAVSGASAAGG